MTTAIEKLSVGAELDRAVAENVMGFQRWRIARYLPTAPDYEGPLEEDVEAIGYVLATERHIRLHFADSAFESGMVRLADPDTPPFADAGRWVPNFSTMAGGGASVVAELHRRHQWTLVGASCLLGRVGKPFTCRIDEGDRQWDGQGQTAEEAICRAALAAYPAPPGRMGSQNETPPTGGAGGPV